MCISRKFSTVITLPLYLGMCLINFRLGVIERWPSSSDRQVGRAAENSSIHSGCLLDYNSTYNTIGFKLNDVSMNVGTKLGSSPCQIGIGLRCLTPQNYFWQQAVRVRLQLVALTSAIPGKQGISKVRRGMTKQQYRETIPMNERRGNKGWSTVKTRWWLWLRNITHST